MNDQNSENHHVYDVIIIGGGCAGLKAGEVLSSNGFKNILLLEAQERIGGRMNTLYLNNDKTKPIEFGATWIHGITGNPLKKLIDESPDIFQPSISRDFDIFESSKLYIGMNCKKYNPDMCEEIISTFQEWSNQAENIWRDGNEVLQDKSLDEYFNNLFENFIKNDRTELVNIKNALLLTHKIAECNLSGCNNLNELSLNAFGSYSLLPGPDEEFPGGYSTLIQYLAKKLPENSIRLNHPVQEIAIENEDEKNFTIKIQCNNNSVFLAKHVIVTCSLNYLKENHNTLFKNLLNERKIEAINRINMGVVDNLYLVYENDIQFIPSTINLVTPLFFEFEKTNWYTTMFVIFKYYDNVLRFFIHGDNAIYIENASDDEIATKLTELLKALFKNEEIPLPKQVIKSKWHSNPYIRGGYSYVPLNSSSDFIKKLAEPIYFHNSPKILFAGEATSENFYSTVHGAYMTGEREANRLINHLI